MGLLGVKLKFFAVFVFFRIYGVFFDESCVVFNKNSPVLCTFCKIGPSRGGCRGILAIFSN